MVVLSTQARDSRKVETEYATRVEDPAWDAFLQGNPLGHFQQSSLWARYKAAEGWQPLRVMWRLEGRLVGGFQLLERRSRLGRIAYVSKGPAVWPEEPELARSVLETLRRVAQERRLLALVVQPPDASSLEASWFGQLGFVPNEHLGVIRATLLVDVRDGLPTVEARMRRTTRNEIRQARRAGVTVREGGRDDLGLFFELMTATCRRQKVVPNPASEPVLRAMWDAFASQALIRLTFAEHAGTALAGALLIRFGERATLFKKGWCSTQANLRSNQLLTFELLEYIHSQGWRCLDFAGLDPSIAHALLRHQPLSPEQTRGRDFFHLGFGGQPVLLPPAVIWFRNRLVEWGFHLAVRCKQALRHGVRR